MKILKLTIIITFLYNNLNICKDNMNIVEQNLNKFNLTLPQVSIPVANYVPFVQTDKLIFISGQLPMENGKLKYAGKVDKDISLEDAKLAAQLCALNILAQVKTCVGSFDKIKRCIKLTGFVNAPEGFAAHPQIINGASDLLVNLLGEKGKHARAAVGASSLPLNAAVEIEAIFEIE